MLKVLVVEDDKYFNKLLSDYLKLEGFDVMSVLDGDEAWTELHATLHQKRPYDLILVDMLLPKKMGAELLTEINETKEFEKLRRIGMSGIYKNEAEIKQIKILYGLEEYLTKPFDLNLLNSLLKNEKPEGTEAEDWLGSGDLSQRPLEFLFFDAYRQAFTGRLSLSKEQTERRIYFLNGHPVSANSSSISESFGNALVSMGYISLATREEASRKMVIEQLHFGETLVQMNAIEKNDLFKALRDHTRNLIIASFLSRQGQYRFEKMEELPSSLPHIEFNPFILMLEAQEKLISIEALASVFNLKMELFPRKQKRWTQLISLFKTSNANLQVLTKISSKVSLKDTLKSLESKDRKELLRILYFLESIEVLSWKNEPDDDPTSDESLGFDFHSQVSPLPTSEAKVKELDDRIFALYMDTLNYNFLELLKVTEDVNETDLREAYRKIRFEFHPDRFGDQISGQSQRILDDILARLDKAYQTLSDTESREEYLKTIRKVSADSALQSKRYLQALDTFREAKKLMEGEKFAEARQKFDEAFKIWPSGIEYRMYSQYALVKQNIAERENLDLSPELHKFRELAYAYAHSDVGFLLLGHLYRVAKQYEAAREAYNKARQLSPQSQEVENALVRLASEEKSSKGISLGFKISAGKVLKIFGYLLLFGLVVGAYSQRHRFDRKDTDVRELDISAIKGIIAAKSIRKKEDIAKIIVSKDEISPLPEAVLKSKCLQIFDKIGLYGIMRLYIFEEGAGLKAFCTETIFEKY